MTQNPACGPRPRLQSHQKRRRRRGGSNRKKAKHIEFEEADPDTKYNTPSSASDRLGRRAGVGDTTLVPTLRLPEGDVVLEQVEGQGAGLQDRVLHATGPSEAASEPEHADDGVWEAVWAFLEDGDREVGPDMRDLDARAGDAVWSDP